MRYFYSDLSNNEIKLFKSILEKVRNEEIEFQFLSFNYTTLLDRYVLSLGENGREEIFFDGGTTQLNVAPSVVHINGTLDEFPILGVDNDEQLINEAFRSHGRIREIMIKRESKGSVDAEEYSIALKHINDSNIVCIYGMSLGESDNYWWSELTKWLNRGPSRHLVIYSYKNPPVKKRVGLYNDKVEEEKKLFLSYSMLSEAANAEISRRIHVVFNSDIFNLKFQTIMVT